MRKIIYLNTEKSEFLKIGMYIVLGLTIFLTLTQGVYCLAHPDVKYDFSIYIFSLIIFAFILFGYLLEMALDKVPISKMLKKQKKELLNSGFRCDGEIIEIRKQLFSSGYRNFYAYSLKVKYFSKVYNGYLEKITPPIKNLYENDVIGNSKKCVIYEKKDATIKDDSETYYGESNSIDLLKFFSIRNIINGLKFKTTKGYAFIVTEANIINKSQC